MAKLEPFGWVFTPKTKGATRIEVKPSPVVFCRDCVDYEPWYPDGTCICLRYGSYFGNTKPDDYCSRGTLRDGVKPLEYEDARKKVYVEITEVSRDADTQ